MYLFVKAVIVTYTQNYSKVVDTLENKLEDFPNDKYRSVCLKMNLSGCYNDNNLLYDASSMKMHV
jgi:hypothetical protein